METKPQGFYAKPNKFLTTKHNRNDFRRTSSDAR